MGLTSQTHDFDSALTSCDTEPIHIPGSIQPYGILLAVSRQSGKVLQCSANAAKLFSRDVANILGASLAELFGEKNSGILRDLFAAIQHESGEKFAQQTLANFQLREGGEPLTVIAHESDGATVLEFETIPHSDSSNWEESYPVTSRFIQHVQNARDLRELSQLAAAEVRRLTGFDRVLIYRFDEQWNGSVIGEDGNGKLPSYLDHRFPAADIPRQARELYRVNRLRLIADVNYQPVPIVPVMRPDTEKPLDLTHSVLRSVSPIHVEYMKNMETAASMSISIVRENRLWGLVSCHHRTPRQVPYFIRAACDLISQVLALQVAATEHHAEYERRVELNAIQAELLNQMIADTDFRYGLCRNPETLLRFAMAGGAAVVTEDQCLTVGDTPPEEAIRRLTRWLTSDVGREVYWTSALALEFPEAASFATTGSGLLAISISKLHPSYVLWFRPEEPQTVKWAGDPTVAKHSDLSRLHPRKSFDTWKESVRGRSLPFRMSEIDAAVELRNAIVGIVLRKAESLAELTVELERSNKELEAFSYSVSHDLRAPFRHIVGYAELLRERALGRLDSEESRFLQAISESAEQAGQLVDNLLAHSRVGRQQLNLQPMDFNEVFEQARREVLKDAPNREIEWSIAKLPEIHGDIMMLRLAVQNLLSNAVKYTSTRKPAVIEVHYEATPKEHVFVVKDNGVGFDMQFAGKLFGVFQRMHRMEDFEGTGIGLANVRRIIARHGGRTWAEAEIDCGASFYFTLPRAENWSDSRDQRG